MREAGGLGVDVEGAAEIDGSKTLVERELGDQLAGSDETPTQARGTLGVIGVERLRDDVNVAASIGANRSGEARSLGATALGFGLTVREREQTGLDAVGAAEGLIENRFIGYR